MSTAAGSPGSSAVRSARYMRQAVEPRAARRRRARRCRSRHRRAASSVVAASAISVCAVLRAGRVERRAARSATRERQRRGAGEAARQPAGEREHGEAVEDGEHRRGGEQPGPDRRRRAAARARARLPCQPIAAGTSGASTLSRVHGVQREDRAVAVVEAGRRLRRSAFASSMSATSVAPGGAARDRRSRRAPRPGSRARRLRCARLGSASPRSALHGARHVDDGVQHLHERAGERQVRPARIGGDMEEHDAALASRARR